MRYIFSFPDIGEGIHEGKILQWYVAKGQSIQSGDALVKMETDKVVTDIPSPRSGAIAALYGKEGEVVRVGDPLVEIDIPGLDGEEAQKVAKEKPVVKSESAVEEKGFGVVGTLEVAGDAARLAPSTEGVPSAQPEPVTAGKPLATPVARAMAKVLGIDIHRVRGTGPAGRVTKEDIQKFHGQFRTQPPEILAKPETASDAEILPLSQIRKAIARNMSLSKQTAAHMTVFEEVEISELVRIRNTYKEIYEKQGMKLTFLPLIVTAVCRALQHHPWLNSQLDMEKGQVWLKHRCHIGIAVDTGEGLVVPVIRDADRLSISDLSREIQRLKEKALSRTLALSDLQDGTFTVTNYGSLGGTYGVPVINYPQSAILGIGRIMKVPVVKGDQITIGQVLPLSLSVDHRIIDGGAATRFINELIRLLADPIALWLQPDTQPGIPSGSR